MSWTVYRHIAPNGKSYIGITCKKPERRWREGRGYRKDTPFGKAIKKYGWNNIQHNIVSSDLTETEAKWLENYLICYYRTFVYFYDCKGYNCTLGGDGQVGWEQSEETKQRISEKKKGRPCKPPTEETKRKISESRKGIKFSDEHRRRISESHKGIHPTKETRTRMSKSHKGKTAWNKGKPSNTKGMHRVYHEDGTFHMER